MPQNGCCINCGVSISDKALRCVDCKRINDNKSRREKRKVQTIVTYCIGCGEDISELGNRSLRCKKCQRDFNNFRRREKRAKEKEGIIRICRQCKEVDISDRSYNAVICWSCRRKNAAKTNKDYYLKHKEGHRIAQQKYYDKNKKKITKKNLKYQQKQRKKKKQILGMELPKDDGNSEHWTDWDNVPRCEGITLDMKSVKNVFGNECKLRASYRLVDKYDGTVRYVCRLHIKTIGSLKWYHIERLEHSTITRRTILFKWKKMQKEERKKKIKKWKKKRKSCKKEWEPKPYHNAHYPIINGKYQNHVPFPSNNNRDDE